MTVLWFEGNCTRSRNFVAGKGLKKRKEKGVVRCEVSCWFNVWDTAVSDCQTNLFKQEKSIPAYAGFLNNGSVVDSFGWYHSFPLQGTILTQSAETTWDQCTVLCSLWWPTSDSTDTITSISRSNLGPCTCNIYVAFNIINYCCRIYRVCRGCCYFEFISVCLHRGCVYFKVTMNEVTCKHCAKIG